MKASRGHAARCERGDFGPCPAQAAHPVMEMVVAVAEGKDHRRCEMRNTTEQLTLVKGGTRMRRPCKARAALDMRTDYRPGALFAGMLAPRMTRGTPFASWQASVMPTARWYAPCATSYVKVRFAGKCPPCSPHRAM